MITPKQILQKALDAFDKNDFQTTAFLITNSYCLSEASNQEVINLFNKIKAHIDTGTNNPDLYAMLSYICIDYSDLFYEDREEALMDVLQWSKAGIEIDSNHYNNQRQAGSALYWLGDYEGAVKYYKKANEIEPSPTLQIRLFNIEMEHQNDDEEIDLFSLQIDFNSIHAMEYYNTGVEIDNLIKSFEDLSQEETDHLVGLKVNCYVKAYELFHGALLANNGDLINIQPHTFAMCCNNIAHVCIMDKDYEKAVGYCNDGLQFSYFQYIVENRYYAHRNLEMNDEAFEDALHLYNDFYQEISLDRYFDIIRFISSQLHNKKEHEDAIKFAEEGIETYNNLDFEDPIRTDADVLVYYTNLFTTKALSEQALGIYHHTEDSSNEIDTALGEMPTDPTLIINRAIAFDGEGNFEKAIECYQYAIHYALEQDKKHSAKTAYFNLGYIYITQYKNYQKALENYYAILALEMADFWTYYWIGHCSYSLDLNEECIQYSALALQQLANEQNIHHEIIAQLFEYIATSQSDLGDYERALENYNYSLQYNDLELTRQNIKNVEEALKKKNGGGFLKNLFGGK